MKWLKDLKREFYITRRAFFERKIGFRYIYYRFIKGPSILGWKKPIETPVVYEDLAVHILVCARDLVMTLWSLVSFYQKSGVVGKLYIHSDGSLKEKHFRILRRLLPSAEIILPEDFEKEFAAMDVQEWIKKFRTEQDVVFLKKLVDPNYTSDEPYIFVIDPDLWWMDVCKEVQMVMEGKDDHAHMMASDQVNKVWFTNDEELPDELSYFNGGMIFYKKDQLDFDRLAEFFSRIDMNKKQLFIGQSGHAYSLNNLLPLPLDEYVVRGPISEKTRVKHYTSPERERFFTIGVPEIERYVRD